MTVSSQMKTPKVVQIKQMGNNRSLVVLEPFERGFGTTIMAPMRRIMLSSMVGHAIVMMNIEGMTDGYSALEGVLEDAVLIALNLKGVAIKINNADAAQLIINKVGPGVVYAKDIVSDADIEIMNPDHVIATITEDRSLILLVMQCLD